MKSVERRKAIATLLSSSKDPISGGTLSEKYGVSRQIIVHDIALLKSAGFDIISTHYGYILHGSPLIERAIKVRHKSSETEDELNCIVDNGGTVVDVFIWHTVYGKITAQLNIFSRLQVKQFMEGVRSGKASELMHITDGYHYHTIRTDDEKTMNYIIDVLREKNYLVSEGE